MIYSYSLLADSILSGVGNNAQSEKFPLLIHFWMVCRREFRICRQIYVSEIPLLKFIANLVKASSFNETGEKRLRHPLKGKVHLNFSFSENTGLPVHFRPDRLFLQLHTLHNRWTLSQDVLVTFSHSPHKICTQYPQTSLASLGDSLACVIQCLLLLSS